MPFECHCGEEFDTPDELLNHELEMSSLTDLIDPDLFKEELEDLNSHD